MSTVTDDQLLDAILSDWMPTAEQIDALAPDERSALLVFLNKKLSEWSFSMPGRRNERALLAEAIIPHVDWMLYGGAAGGAKTEMGLKHAFDMSMKFPGHRTLILRTSKPELRRSIVMRSIARFHQLKVPAKLRSTDNVLMWHFDNGSTIEFGYCNRPEDVGQYLSAEYECLASDAQIVMADGSPRPISAVVPGEFVLTLEGPRRVLASRPVGAKPVVEITTSRGSVVAARDHALFTGSSWASPLELMSTPLRRGEPISGASLALPPASPRRIWWKRSGLQPAFAPLRQSLASSRHQATSVCPEDARTEYVASCGGRRASSPPPSWSGFVAVAEVPVRLSASPTSTCSPGRAQARVPDGSPTSDCPDDCPSCRGSDGAPSRPGRAAGRGRLRGPFGVASRTRSRWPLGGPERTRSGSRPHRGVLPHPYTNEARQASVAFHLASASIRPAGEVETWDLTVEGANHYISSSGIIHRNCVWFDEATQFWWAEQVLPITGRLRTSVDQVDAGVTPHALLTSNPGDKGHASLYDIFVLASNHGQFIVVYDVSNGVEGAPIARLIPMPQTAEEAATMEPIARSDEEIAVAFIPSKATDNPHIDPSYRKALSALPEIERKQKRDGDWDTFSGQFFGEWRRDLHVVPEFEIPADWQKARGIDYGNSAPWCCLWGAWDQDGNLWVYRELYAAQRTTKQQATEAVAASIGERYMMTVADPSTFSKTGAGDPISTQWRHHGLHVTKANNDRKSGWANLRNYLAWAETGAPRIFVTEACPNLIRTLPLMQRDKTRPEDLNTRLEDHAVDALRYLALVRPASRSAAKPPERVGAEGQFDRLVRSMRRKERKTAWS